MWFQGLWLWLYFQGLKIELDHSNSWEDNLKTLLAKCIPSKAASLCLRKHGDVPATHGVVDVSACGCGYSGTSCLLEESCPLETQAFRAFAGPRTQNSHPPTLNLSCYAKQDPGRCQKDKENDMGKERRRDGRRLGLSSGPQEQGCGLSASRPEFPSSSSPLTWNRQRILTLMFIPPQLFPTACYWPCPVHGGTSLCRSSLLQGPGPWTKGSNYCPVRSKNSG